MRLFLLLAAAAAVMLAQGRGGPPLMDWGAHGDTEIICGAHSPEDLELTPDGWFMMATRFARGARLLGAAGSTYWTWQEKASRRWRWPRSRA